MTVAVERKDFSMEDSQFNETDSHRTSPFLTQWKTSVGASVAGMFCSYAIGRIAEHLPISLSALICVAPFVYALWYYPSLFKNEAQARSSAAISFGNGLFGGLVFGAIWNSCLTNGKIGISHYVFVVILVAVFVLSFVAASYA